MAKTQHDESMKDVLYIVHRNQVSAFMKKYFPTFSTSLQHIIRNILRSCFQWEADMVMLFLNNDKGNYTCCCFTPIYTDEAVLHRNEGNITDVNDVAALPSYRLGSIYKLELNDIYLYSLFSAAVNFGRWQKEYSFMALNEEEDDEMYKINTNPFSEYKITKETLEFEEEQLEMYKRMVKENPKNERTRWARDCLVKQITDHRKELDRETGFTQLQFDAYDYSLRMPDVIDRKFDAGRFEPFIELVSSFFRNVHQSLQNVYGLRIADAGAGSAVLFIDIIPRNLDKETKKDWDKGKEHFRKTVSAMPELTKIGDADVRVNNFCQEAELDPEQAKEILKTAQKIFPKSVDKEGAIEIYSQSEENPIAKFNKDGHLNFAKAKKNLSDSLKPTEETIISGFLGLIVGWETEDPRFVIETDATDTGKKRRITIKYDKEKTDEVKSRFKKQVKLERIKDGRSWRLVDWKR